MLQWQRDSKIIGDEVIYADSVLKIFFFRFLLYTCFQS